MNPTAQTSQVCLLLGSNIAPAKNLPKAITLLRQHVDIDNISQVWETPAVGSDGPAFLNAAVLVHTELDSAQLKEQALRPIEKHLGRVRSANKYAPRPIDIDIVAWACQVTDPDVWTYAHAAVPVSEVLPCNPVSAEGESLSQTAARLKASTLILPKNLSS